MKRLSGPLALYATCVLIVTAALAGLTWHVLRLQRQERAARQAAEREEYTRLALWRMDSALATLWAGENARPHDGFCQALDVTQYVAASDVAQASPRATIDVAGIPSQFVLIRFQKDAAGQWTGSVPTMAGSSQPSRAETTQVLMQFLAASEKLAQLQGRLPLDEDELDPAVVTATDARDRGAIEFNNRAVQVANSVKLRQNFGTTADFRLRIGPLIPLWEDERLILARRVFLGNDDLLQGTCLDWQGLSAHLLSTIGDLLPGAELLRVEAPERVPQGYLLASLPVRLEPGPLLSTDGGSLNSAAGWALVAAWACWVAAALALGGLLWGLSALADRRASFVSAVTHELRTPLTTLRLYVGLLAADAVPDAARRDEYLATLSREADRLCHLVENVLSFARLERGKNFRHREWLAWPDLFSRVQDRLRSRVIEANMEWVASSTAAANDALVHVDVSAVDRILFNLVDNACHYAKSAADRRVHCEADSDGRQLSITIRDHGPGLPVAGIRRLARPFQRSVAQIAAQSGGVGIGLALSRRLARQLGGKLTAEGGSSGASLTLWLPCQPKSGKQKGDILLY